MVGLCGCSALSKAQNNRRWVPGRFREGSPGATECYSARSHAPPAWYGLRHAHLLMSFYVFLCLSPCSQGSALAQRKMTPPVASPLDLQPTRCALNIFEMHSASDCSSPRVNALRNVTRTSRAPALPCHASPVAARPHQMPR